MRRAKKLDESLTSAVGEVSGLRIVWGTGIKVGRHICRRQLLEGARFYTDTAEKLVNARQAVIADFSKYEICERTPMVGRRNSNEGPNCHVSWAKVRDHVSCVQPAHTVGNYVHLPATGSTGNPAGELLSPLLDASGGGHGCGDDVYAIGLEGRDNSPPVVDGRQPARREIKLGETQQSMGQDDWKLRCCWGVTLTGKNRKRMRGRRGGGIEGKAVQWDKTEYCCNLTIVVPNMSILVVYALPQSSQPWVGFTGIIRLGRCNLAT